MKLHILSDLHLGVGALEPPRTDANLVVLAGDIARPAAAVSWAQRFGKPVLYVLGNHEFYGGSLDGTVAEFRRLCAGTAVRLLDDEAIVIDGVRFLGSTLWSDFGLFATEQERQQAIEMAQQLVRDFSRIRRRADGDALFTPHDAAARFARHAAWLDRHRRHRGAGAADHAVRAAGGVRGGARLAADARLAAGAPHVREDHPRLAARGRGLAAGEAAVQRHHGGVRAGAGPDRAEVVDGRHRLHLHGLRLGLAVAPAGAATVTRRRRDSASGRGYTARMNRLAATLLLVLALAACGNKGPLVKPEAKPAATPATTTPAAEPAKSEAGTPVR